ncbi:metallophosphoesterase family protein [Roseibium salinum]|uniref:Metallophosphoesterase n=1 Tax=Roseibium salinum TaxID=1604349 RepID=A0ABT3R6G5_9HYPH|nr:metallophosphoesterase [Roseibium sp. DSM 29163]MCX2724612.1 metallophosphoesterase [Roseibium sp. DSM 29163]
MHLASEPNREALQDLPSHDEDWLIVAGDIAEKFEHVRLAFETLTRKFAKVFWVPGNHDLWAIPDRNDGPALAGEARYRALVDCARDYGVLTPEDPFETWEGSGGPLVIAPLFLLYDYSFRPDHIGRDEVVDWAREEGAVCADELFLNHAPFESREDWCARRCEETERRLEEIPDGLPTILVNHYPLRRDLIHIPRAPRFTPWCGTRRTEDWHRRFNARVVISGHLHTRRTDWRDGSRFEEVSLGYPRQWDQNKGMAHYLRDVLPE